LDRLEQKVDLVLRNRSDPQVERKLDLILRNLAKGSADEAYWSMGAGERGKK